MADNLQIDRDLFPKYVITAWTDVRDADGNLVAFTPEDCSELLNALPDWMMQQLSAWAAQASNFLPDDMPDEVDVEEIAEK